jgi:pimeloyl-ACP methyl ester carboxylesterase
MRGWLLGLAALSTLALLAACTTGGQPSPPTPSGPLAPYYSQHLTWSPCDQGRCATLRVPADYAKPAGPSIELAVARIEATGGAGGRLGSLVMDPGGPGVSGVDALRDARQAIGETVLARYDLVGWDPRGVQRSSPAQCLDAPQLDTLFSTDFDYSTDGGIRQAEDAWGAFARGCEQTLGDELAHIDTQSTARDLDILRAALGDSRLTYLGWSYGTALGATYAAMFPTHVGRAVLDGVELPTVAVDELSAVQAAGFEQELRAYVADCETLPHCVLTGGVDHGLQQIAALFAQAHAHPLPTGTPLALTATLAETGVGEALYSPGYWTGLTSALGEAIGSGDGSGLLDLADGYLFRTRSGQYAANLQQAYYAIECDDGPGNHDIAAMRDQAAKIMAVAPTIGPWFTYQAAMCAQWPVPPTPHLASYAARGAPPILLVGTTGDPATPYAWAKQVASMLSSARLLTYKGEGHTAYGGTDQCVNGAVDRYLLTGTLPAAGTTC